MTLGRGLGSFSCMKVALTASPSCISIIDGESFFIFGRLLANPDISSVEGRDRLFFWFPHLPLKG